MTKELLHQEFPEYTIRESVLNYKENRILYLVIGKSINIHFTLYNKENLLEIDLFYNGEFRLSSSSSLNDYVLSLETIKDEINELTRDEIESSI